MGTIHSESPTSKQSFLTTQVESPAGQGWRLPHSQAPGGHPGHGIAGSRSDGGPSGPMVPRQPQRAACLGARACPQNEAEPGGGASWLHKAALLQDMAPLGCTVGGPGSLGMCGVRNRRRASSGAHGKTSQALVSRATLPPLQPLPGPHQAPSSPRPRVCHLRNGLTTSAARVGVGDQLCTPAVPWQEWQRLRDFKLGCQHVRSHHALPEASAEWARSSGLALRRR